MNAIRHHITNGKVAPRISEFAGNLLQRDDFVVGDLSADDPRHDPVMHLENRDLVDIGQNKRLTRIVFGGERLKDRTWLTVV